MVYFLRGSLPWDGLVAQNQKEKHDRIIEKKMITPIEELCSGFPIEFITYLNYARSLRFDDKPNYLCLRELFRTLYVRSGFQFDYVFDWTAEVAAGQQAQLGPYPSAVHAPWAP